MGWRSVFSAGVPLLAAAAVAYSGIWMGPRWVAANTPQAPDADAVQLSQMASRAGPNALRNVPDGTLRAVRIEPGETASYFFQYRGTGDPTRETFWSIKVANGQEVSSTGAVPFGGRNGAGGQRAPSPPPAGLALTGAPGDETLDLNQLRVGPGGASRAAEASWPGCKVNYLLLHALASDTPEWTVYCTLPDRRVGWGEVDNLNGHLAAQPLPSPLPSKPARMSQQPAANAPVDPGCLNGTAAVAASVPNTSQEEAEVGAQRFRAGGSNLLFTAAPPQPRLGELLSAQPVTYSSADGQRQNLAVWLLVYEWLPTSPEDHASRFYTLVGGQNGNAGFGSCSR